MTPEREEAPCRVCDRPSCFLGSKCGGQRLYTAPGRHVIRVSADSIALLHPDGCVECAEGAYERRRGLTEYEGWAVGDHGVAYWSLFDDDGEYAEGLQLTYDGVPDPDDFYPQPTDPQPVSGVVRGFPYSGGRWDA